MHFHIPSRLFMIRVMTVTRKIADLSYFLWERDSSRQRIVTLFECKPPQARILFPYKWTLQNSTLLVSRQYLNPTPDFLNCIKKTGDDRGRGVDI